MEGLIRRVEKLANIKGVTVLVLLLMVGFFVYRNLDFIYEITFKIDRPHQTPAAPQQPPLKYARFLQIERVDVPPAAFGLPAYFLVAVRNNGRETGAAEFTVDFGRALVQQFETRPTENVTVISGGVGSSAIKLLFQQVGPDEAVYLYALTSQPGFAQISIRGGGNSPKVVKADDFKAGELRFFNSNMMSFFRFVFGVLLVAGSITAIVFMVKWLEARKARMAGKVDEQVDDAYG